MDDAEERRYLPKIWEHFTKVDDHTAKCKICSAEVKYFWNLVGALEKHLASKHPPPPVSQENMDPDRKREIDEALVNMVVSSSLFDCSVVDGVGFKAMMETLDPTYTLPTKKELKKMVKKYKEERRRRATEK